MKNKIITAIIGIIFIMFLVIVLAVPAYAEGNIEANVILDKDVNSDNKIDVSIETSQNQSIASFNISLIIESANIQDIKSMKMDWNSDISNNSELYEVTYNNSKINIYVVSKNELGNNNGNHRRINIGTITIETDNKVNIDVIVRAQKDLTRIVSIGHENATITNDISTMIQLQISPKALTGDQSGNTNQEDSNNPDSDNISSESDNETQGGSNQEANGSQSEGDSKTSNGIQEENSGQNGNDILGENDSLSGDSDNVNDENKLDDKNNTDSNKNENDLAQEELPKTGIVINNAIIVAIIAIGVVILITIVRIKSRTRHSKHYKR